MTVILDRGGAFFLLFVFFRLFCGGERVFAGYVVCLDFRCGFFSVLVLSGSGTSVYSGCVLMFIVFSSVCLFWFSVVFTVICGSGVSLELCGI